MATTKKQSTADVVAQAKAMLAQTKAEGSKSFSGSSYDSSSKNYNAKKTTSAVSKLPTSTTNESVAQSVARANAMLAQTAAQGETPFAGSTFEAEYLKAPTAPLSADQISQLGSTTVPTADPTVVNPAGAISVSAGMQAYMDAIKKQLEQQQARNDKMAKENQTLLEKTLGTMKNPEDVYD